jgi:hypothetical protein
MNNILFKRIRNNKGNPKGVLIAMPINDTEVGIGWSLSSSKDNFDLSMGKRIAEGRTSAFEPEKMPHSIRVDFNKFAQRCERYFKGHTVIGAKVFENIS